MVHTDESVAALCKKRVDASKKGLSQQYNNTTLCRAFYNGDVMDYRDQIQFVDTRGRKRRATVNFNKVQSNVNAVGGFMSQNRRQAKYLARVNQSEGQQLYSRNMNAIYTYHRENTNSDQLESAQDMDMLINGYGAIETELSYIVGNATMSPNGEIVKVKLDPMRVGWDPTARSPNLLDSRWAYYYEDYDLKDALNLFQDSKEKDFAKASDDAPEDITGYQYNPYGGLYDKIKAMDEVDWASKSEDRVRVYNFQWFEFETFYKARNPLYVVGTFEDASYIKLRLDVIKDGIKSYAPTGIDAGDMFDFDPLAEEFTFDEATKRKLVAEFGDLIKPVAFKRKCFYTAVTSGSHVFTWFKSISQQGFSVKFKTGIYNEQGKFWTGMVNPMMEPAKYYNKAVTEFMFTVASLSKGGVMVERSAVEDVADFEQKWAKTNALIVVEDGAISGARIKEKSQGMLPTGIDTIITLADSAINQNGVDAGFMGEAASQESGILYKRRIRQAISKFAMYFDSGTLYQKEDARLNLDLIRVWVQNNEGVWVRITGDQGADEFEQLSQDMFAAEYDVDIQEAPLAPEEKQETASMLAQQGLAILPINPSVGQGMLAEAIQMYPIDSEQRKRLVAMLQPEDTVPMAQYQQLEAQLQQMQSEMSQLQAAKLAAETEKIRAQTAKEQASTADTLEAAANKGLENDIIRSGEYKEATVNI